MQTCSAVSISLLSARATVPCPLPGARQGLEGRAPWVSCSPTSSLRCERLVFSTGTIGFLGRSYSFQIHRDLSAFETGSGPGVLHCGIIRSPALTGRITEPQHTWAARTQGSRAIQVPCTGGGGWGGGPRVSAGTHAQLSHGLHFREFEDKMTEDFALFGVARWTECGELPGSIPSQGTSLGFGSGPQ